MSCTNVIQYTYAPIKVEYLRIEYDEVIRYHLYAGEEMAP